MGVVYLAPLTVISVEFVALIVRSEEAMVAGVVVEGILQSAPYPVPPERQL